MAAHDKARTTMKIAKSRRAVALLRDELRYATVPRRPPAGVVSFALKEVDPDVARMVAAHIEKHGVRR